MYVSKMVIEIACVDTFTVETGSFDPCLASFVETRLFGSQGTTCVTGFDQASYISGISSNLWTAFNSTVRGYSKDVQTIRH